jgi:NADH dehydrogenase/NADH:ubiquinone oxidoreductase subunit G
MNEIEILRAENERLKANLEQAAKAHAADFEALGKLKAEYDALVQHNNEGRKKHLELLNELAARDAAQQRAGVVKAFRKAADGGFFWFLTWDTLRNTADAIERGEVEL